MSWSTTYFVWPSPLFPFRQAQFVQVFPLMPAKFCKLSTGLGSTNKFAISLFVSSSQALTLSYPTFYSKPSGRCGRNFLLFSPLRSSYKWSPETYFFRETMQLMRWPDGVRYCWLLQSFVVSLLLPVVSTLLFSRAEVVTSHRNSSKHRFPQN